MDIRFMGLTEPFFKLWKYTTLPQDFGHSNQMIKYVPYFKPLFLGKRINPDVCFKLRVRLHQPGVKHFSVPSTVRTNKLWRLITPRKPV
jgi:hypothetical protein